MSDKEEEELDSYDREVSLYLQNIENKDNGLNVYNKTNKSQVNIFK